MNASSTTPTSLATAYSRSTTLPPLAMTTPFVPPSDCGNVFITTSGSRSYYRDDPFVTILASVPALNPTCQPEGWNRTGPGLLAFSPAVCPSAWTAYGISVHTTGTGDGYAPFTFASIAHCCSSGFSYTTIAGLNIVGNRDDACVQEISMSSTPTPDVTTHNGVVYASTSVIPRAIRAHVPWDISWQKTDVATLSPSPPPLKACWNVQISTWIPGSVVKKSSRAPCDQFNGEDHLPNILGPGYMFIWLPILVFLFIVGGCTSCLCHHRKQERKKKLRAAANLPQPPNAPGGEKSQPGDTSASP